MFQEIQPHLKAGTTLSLAISVLPDGDLNVILNQQADGALAGHQLPKALTASAAEFDESLTDVLVKYLSVRRSLNDQISDLEVVAKSIADEAQEAVKSSPSKPSASVQRPKPRNAVPPALLDPDDSDDGLDNEAVASNTNSAESVAPAVSQVAVNQMDFGL